MFWRAMALVSVCACSGPDPTAYVGTWRYNPDVTNTNTCGNPPSSLAGFDVVIAKGTSSDLAIGEGTSCPILFSVTDHGAEAEKKPCQVVLGGSGCPVVSGTMTYYPYTLVLDSTGKTLTVAQHWEGLYGNYGCSAKNCSGDTTGTATRIE